MSTPTPTPTLTPNGFTFKDWEEHPVGPEGVFPRLARATVTNAFTGALTAPATTCAYTVAYTGDSTGTFTGMELVTGTVDGREGAFVLEERGTFDATGTHCSFTVVPGSGTGGLTGLGGSGSFAHRYGDTSVEYAFDYAFTAAAQSA
ncbi:DUF3224 domain-containing protein [Streptomyces sp. NBC_00193]|uniref:DUF3224 domain-containing protein n=1 Tax=unclassified Streptomyces TaxID=2593676 RepID=UPI00224D7A7F|nr:MULTISPECIES: DUF3224 domain-containing protein [unclassified Streptomyces]MCX5126626.1 DUF3224 domain-containing protein [Streptomyces sp. NBC_00347]MCX5300260.1 DUF3224 domain-containing protein [Streptomyces sp. NBC_00193]